MTRRMIYTAGLLCSTLFTLHSSAQPQFSLAHGVYDRSHVRLTIAAQTAGAEIRYTTDGSVPTAASKLYTSSLGFSKTTCLRAVEMIGDSVVSPVTTATYILVNSLLAQQGVPTGYPAKWGSYCQISGTATADYDMNATMTGDATLKPHIVQGLKDLPVLSIVTDKDNLFSHECDSVTGGIYIYTGPPVGDPTGHGWTRAASVELMGGPQGHDLTADCGVSLHGGHGRLAEKNPKHSFRLKFKKEYGAKTLDYPVFGADEPSVFNQLVLRCHFGNSWQHWSSGGRDYAQYSRDVWARRMQRKMGHAASNALYVHLFLNGLYWGLYNIAERIDDQFCKNHLGGKKSDYDVVKLEENGGNHVEAAEGDLEKWNQMKRTARLAADDTYYYMLEGRDANGQRDETLEPLLDMDNLIDYMLINFYGGNTDWDHHNWYAYAGKGEQATGFRFICWDTEQIFENVWEDRTGTENHGMPSEMFRCLMQNDRFKQRFAHRAHQLLDGDGLLTPARVVEVWDSLYNTISEAVYDEAARWGDYRLVVHQYSSRGKDYNVDKYYMRERNRLLSEYFPYRTGIVISQLEQRGWYTDTGIYSLTSAASQRRDGSYFTLSGQRVDGPGRGIFIRNGRKIINK